MPYLFCTSVLNALTSWDPTARVRVPTGASPDSYPVWRRWRAALLQRSVRRLVHTGSSPRFPGHDWGRAAHAAIFLPGGGAPDGKPDGSAHPQGRLIIFFFFFKLLSPNVNKFCYLVCKRFAVCPWETCAYFWPLDLNDQGLNGCNSVEKPTWDILFLFCLQTLSICRLKHCVALWQLLASLKSENMLRLKRVSQQHQQTHSIFCKCCIVITIIIITLIFINVCFYFLPVSPSRIHLLASQICTKWPWVRRSKDCWLASSPRTAPTVSCWRSTSSWCWSSKSQMRWTPLSRTGGKTNEFKFNNLKFVNLWIKVSCFWFFFYGNHLTVFCLNPPHL